jgi:murein DD-endopeptidase MepM/ murein hydrolase activator NlpD
MQMSVSPIQMLKKTVLILYLVFIHALAGLFVYETWLKPYYFPTDLQTDSIKDPTEITPVPTPQAIPSIETVTPTPEITEIDTNANQAFSNSQIQNNQPAESSQTLMIPVVGIKREQLQDTYNDARSGGRVHNAIDIIAPAGTPVVAVADGEIAKFFDSVRGGITIYQYSPDKHFIYYYGHLQKRADNIKEGDFIKQGTVVGFVGDTGNSGTGNYHLHFSIAVLTDPKRIFDGTEINPFPLLKNGIEAK